MSPITPNRSAKLPRPQNQSLVDGLRVLQFAMMRGDSIGVTGVAEELGIEVTRAHRLLSTLASVGYLRHVKGRKYVSGPAVPILAAQAMRSTGFIKQIFPILNELHESTGMLVAYGLLWDRFVTYLYHAESGVSGMNALVGHSVMDAPTSRLGLVMLASLEESRIRQMYSGHLIPVYQNIDRLLALLRSIHRAGYFYDKCNPAVAIRFEHNPFAALGIAGKIERSEAPQWAERLRAITRKIESLPLIGL